MDDWLTVALEEYKTIRAEILDSIKLQHGILRYGSAIISSIAAAGFAVWDQRPVIAALAFLAFVPLTVAFVGLTWAGEVGRMYRGGTFLLAKESHINERLSKSGAAQPPALIWEHWQSGRYALGEPRWPSPQQRLMLYNRSTYLYLCLAALASMIAGIVRLALNGLAAGLIVVVALIAAALLTSVFVAMSGLAMSFQRYILDSTFVPPISDSHPKPE